MGRYVEKVNIPVFGELYVANADNVNIESMMELQDVLKKLYDYEDAEEQGRLIILPCADGDTIFEIVKINTFNGLGDFLKYETRIEEHKFTKEWCGRIDDFGKTIFLTRETAEQALKEWRM